MAHFQTHRNGLATTKILQHVLRARSARRPSRPSSTDRRAGSVQVAELTECRLRHVVMPMHGHQFKLLTGSGTGGPKYPYPLHI